jgi:hypothetical protein
MMRRASPRSDRSTTGSKPITACQKECEHCYLIVLGREMGIGTHVKRYGKEEVVGTWVGI